MRVSPRCTQSSPCVYVPVPTASWTTTADPSNKDSYPLGYRKGTFYEENNPVFGVRVAGTKYAKVQVMIETMQAEATVCVRDLSPMLNMAVGRAVNQCATQRLNACFDAPADQDFTDFVVYCNQGCRSAQTDFWYRIVVSTNTYAAPIDSSGATVEMWCMNQMGLNTTAFPSTLTPTAPVGYQIADTTKAAVYNPSAAARSATATIAVVCAAAVGALALLF